MFRAMVKGAFAGAAGTTALNAATDLDMAVRAGRLRSPLSALLLGAAAMAASDAPMTRVGLTDPARWSKTEWASDAIPHLAYGLVTTATLRSAH